MRTRAANFRCKGRLRACYNRGVPGTEAKSGYARLEVCRLLGIAESVLEDWERHGFVAKQAQYGFQEMIALKTLRELRRSRYRPDRIRLIIESLRDRLEHIQNPLAELKIYTDGRRLAVQVDGAKMEALTGQLLLDFDREEIQKLLRFPGRPAEDEQARAAAARRFEAERWFDKGVEIEQSGGPLERAIIAYEKALAAEPELAGAHVNLGTIYYHQQEFEKAKACYEQALKARPDYALAHFNLGNLHDELGEWREALKCYLAALEIDPVYADVHYNLALLHQTHGEALKAVKHWRTYLKLDPQGYWAAIARRELAHARESAVVQGKRAHQA